MKLTLPMSLCIALNLSAGATAQTTPQAKNQSQPRAQAHEAAGAFLITPSDKVLGLELATSTDKNVGEIGDLLFDPKSGEIRYAIVEVGGFLGVGEDDRVVPWSLIRIERDPKDADKFRAATTLTEGQVETAPECKAEQVFDGELDRRIVSAFGEDDAWAYVGEGAPTFARVSKVKGAKVTGPHAKELGEVQDVVLAPQNGCVAYLVLDANEDAGDKDVAVPLSRLNIARVGGKDLTITSELDGTRLQGAPEYDEKEWKRMTSTAWVTEMSKYYTSDPFWKSSRFASARPATPSQK